MCEAANQGSSDGSSTNTVRVFNSVTTAATATAALTATQGICLNLFRHPKEAGDQAIGQQAEFVSAAGGTATTTIQLACDAIDGVLAQTAMQRIAYTEDRSPTASMSSSADVFQVRPFGNESQRVVAFTTYLDACLFTPHSTSLQIDRQKSSMLCGHPAYTSNVAFWSSFSHFAASFSLFGMLCRST